MTGGSLSYSPEIDGLRAVSVMSVIIFHSSWQHVLVGGYIGVDIFFVISGYLITSILRREQAECGTISAANFLKRRALRIWPASLAMLSFYGVGAFAFASDSWPHIHAALASAFGLMNWQRALTSQPVGYVGHTWSLAVEEQFYLLWPWALIALGRLRGVWAPTLVIITLIAAVVLWRISLVVRAAGVARTYNGLDTRADALLIGCLMAFLPRKSIPLLVERTWAIPVSFFLLIAVFVPATMQWMHVIGFTLVAMSAGWLILSMTGDETNVLRRMLSTRPVVLIGLISYSLYLWHDPIIQVFQANGFGPATTLVLVPPISVGAAFLSYRLVELPFLRMKNRLVHSRPGAEGSVLASH